MRTVLFLACAAGAFLLCHQVARRLLPPTWKAPTRPDPEGADWYLATYGDIGLDYYVTRFGRWGCAQHLREADILCVSSSKGMYGFDADLLGEKLSRPGRPVRVYNLSFGFGESFHYPMAVIQTLNLRNKVLIDDLTDNTLDFHFSPMAQLALECHHRFEADKILCEKWLAYERDRLCNGTLPRIDYSREQGFQTIPPLHGARNYRRRSNGNIMAVAAATPHWARPGKYPGYPFRYEELREGFFEECRRRNIRIIFTSIPYEGYDPEWGRQIARDLGYPYAGVDDQGIELFDLYHMSTKGREVFSQRLAERLAEEQYGIVAPSE
jgi:hypothetical protein